MMTKTSVATATGLAMAFQQPAGMAQPVAQRPPVRVLPAKVSPGLGFVMPQTTQDWLITGGLGLLGGLAGYYLWKKHRNIGAGIGVVAGLAVVPIVQNVGVYNK